MKILHVNSGNLFGGIETLLVALARYRDECPALEPHFALCYEGKLSQELRKLGCTVHILGHLRLSRPWLVWKAQRRLRALLNDFHFDAVIPHGSWNMTVFGGVARSARVPLAFWLHDPPKPNLTILDRLAGRTQPDLVICNSRYTAASLSHLYSNVKNAVIYCAVSPPEENRPDINRPEVRRRFDTPDEATVILQVSRLDPHKGHHLHLDALGRLKDVAGWVCWQVAGPQRPHEEKYLEELKAKARELGIEDRIRFLGWQPALTPVLEAADIFCQPNSGPEPFGITFIEAMWKGLPVVTTAMGGPLEIISEDCGILVPPGKPEVLAAALGRLITDRDYYQRLSVHAPQRATELCDPGLRIRELHNTLSAITA